MISLPPAGTRAAGGNGGEVAVSEFDGMVAVVTSGQSGIGVATAALLAAHGGTVVAVDREPARISTPREVRHLSADVTDAEGLRRGIGSSPEPSAARTPHRVTGSSPEPSGARTPGRVTGAPKPSPAGM